MAAKYLFRLDDICPTMNWENFNALEDIFSTFNIQPIIGVIPDNQDPTLCIELARSDFWKKMRELVKKKWIIAQHGYQHHYVTSSGGILNINQKSEFSGLSYNVQYEKIKKGKEILEKNIGTSIQWWMAPAHSFDTNTSKALVASGFTYITDGIALFPFRKHGLTWVPQQLWKPRKKLFGVWTICIHPNTVTPEFLEYLKEFISKNAANCVADLNTIPSTVSILNPLYSLWWKFQYAVYKHLLQ